LAVDRSANHGRHVVILGDERAGDDDIVWRILKEKGVAE
jgi:hypothetical protein